MPETVFRIALTPLAEPGRTGRDSVQFLFTANPRMTPQPVERIASGGELSRVMLALKALLAERMQLPTIIFDEIDTGVSGRIADAMGEIIASLSAWDGYFERVADRISAVLTDETRRAVLQIKYDTPDEVKIMGIEYYQAVLRDGVRTYAEFEAWRAANPVEGILEWMP